MKADLTVRDILQRIADRSYTREEGLQLLEGLRRNQAHRPPKRSETCPRINMPTPAGNGQRARDIAIIGMSGIFPDAGDVHAYWDNLRQGRDSVREIPAERWGLEGFYDPDVSTPNRSYSKWGGFLSGIDQFDPLFFSISPREAELMDPQQRLFLQVAWQALEDAGYSPQRLKNSKCGVFVGCWGGDYRNIVSEQRIPPDLYFFSGNAAPILAARISYLLDLKGPSMAIDTACSASLVAIHEACESIWQGTSRMALAGGVTLQTTKEFHILTSKANMLSKDGKCFAFDHRANGFVPGEAVGAVLLKPLQDAERDGDHIYAVIKGSGINQDGKTNGITAPSAPSQTELECEVYDRFGIHPESISYIEAHGTGTQLGDPIEIQALTDAFRRYTSDTGYCAIGSVKTNIGHTQLAAGMAGLIKILLCMQHRKLVPSLHYEEANGHIDFVDSPFYVNTEYRDWQAHSGEPRRAAISAFGFSGTNAHLVIEEYAPPPLDRGAHETQIIILSARSKPRLQAYARRLCDFIDRQVDHAGAGQAVTKKDAAIQDELMAIAAQILGVDEADISLQEEFGEYGFDVVSLTELANQVSENHGIEANLSLLSEYPSLEKLASNIASRRGENQNTDRDEMDFGWEPAGLLADMAYTLQTGREAMQERLAMLVDTIAETRTKLARFAAGETDIGNFFGKNIKQGRALVEERFLDDEEQSRVIETILANGRLDRLAQLWVSGVDIDWTLLPRGAQVRRISLPTYPFA
ncbi:MAG: hypothetical protein N838_21930, partial [Thiohalocapsa sp. PB-PSB1]